MLFAAAAAQDKGKLLALCRANRETILREMPVWRNIAAYPGIDVNDPEQIQKVINGLGAIAATFDKQLGDGSLWEKLRPSKDDDPFAKWRKTLMEADTLMQQRKYQEAIDILNTSLIDSQDLRGSAVIQHRAFAHGRLGHCHFGLGLAADALRHYKHALDCCRELGDGEGMAAYLASSYESHRYLGDGNPAADCAEGAAEVYEALGQAGNAELWKKKAATARAGEPLVRVVVWMGEGEARKRYELDEAPGINGHVQFIFERNRITLPHAESLINDGKKLGRESKYDDALALFRIAAKIDPFQPDSHYQAGLSLVLLQRYGEAVEEYEAALRLGPGWYNVQSDLWLSQRYMLGELGHDAALGLWVQEFQFPERLKILRQMTDRYPNLPHAHLAMGQVLIETGNEEEGVAFLRRGLACDCEPDVQTRLLLRLGISMKDDGREMLERAVAVGGNMMAAAMAKVILKR
jgi:tetratricopeptide (TPR) repeat protein